MLLQGDRVGVELHSHIVRGGGAVDENVLLSVEQVVVGDEAVLLVEERPHESHVVQVAAVGAVHQRVGEILHCADEIVEMQEMAVDAFLLLKSVVTQHNALLELEVLGHLGEPQARRGLAVGGGEQDVVVGGALHPHGDGHLLAPAGGNSGAQINQLDVGETVLVLADGLQRVLVARTVVHNHDLVGGILLLEKQGKVLDG